MLVNLTCQCGKKLTAPLSFASKRAECPSCGRQLRVPPEAQVVDAQEADAIPVASLIEPADLFGFQKASPSSTSPEPASEIIHFIDPPGESPQTTREEGPSWWQRMFAALIDQRSIHWMLTLGGVLIVLGLVNWLVSLGVFQDARIVAAAMTAGALAIHMGGCYLAKATRYATVGRALTFLGCVLVPMNLWFYQAQQLVTIDGALWLASLICCLLYVATVILLRDPLFVFAVQSGVTLTAVLLLGKLALLADPTHICLLLLVLGLLSIHLERLLSPDAEHFSRQEYGLPIFWSGHVQMGLGVLLLASTQLRGLVWGSSVADYAICETTWLAAGAWLGAAYGYFYSDMVVRRHGAYIYVGVACITLSIATAGLELPAEWLIVILSLAGLGVHLLQRMTTQQDRLTRSLPVLSQLLSAAAVLVGLGIYFGELTSSGNQSVSSQFASWTFVLVMIVAAASNRLSAWLDAGANHSRQAYYLLLSAVSLFVAASGMLAVFNLNHFYQQAPLLMLFPMGYLIAARLWRGRAPERPIEAIAHVSSIVVLLQLVISLPQNLTDAGSLKSLLLAIAFVESALFYSFAALMQRRAMFVYLAAATACCGAWQAMTYFHLTAEYLPLIYGVLGFSALLASRRLGVAMVERFRPNGVAYDTLRGPGLSLLQVGCAILLLALTGSALQGIERLTSNRIELGSTWPMLVTAVLGALATIRLVPKGAWQATYMLATVAHFSIVGLTLHTLLGLNIWQTLEIICVVTGVIVLAASHVGRFCENEQPEDGVTLGLWFGSVLAVLPLLIAVLHHRFLGDSWSLADELALFGVSLAMLVTGNSWHIKATTVGGALGLGLHMLMLFVSLALFTQPPVGVYLAVGGTVVFLSGIALSVYRERLLSLPQKIADRKGIFQVLDWR